MEKEVEQSEWTIENNNHQTMQKESTYLCFHNAQAAM